MSPLNRRADIIRFYRILDTLEQCLGGQQRLAECSGRMAWPRRGVYFFFEPGEVRSDSDEGPRVVRVGTHATTAASESRLWGRLSQHRGAARTGGGNHRASIMRLLVGAALRKRSAVDHTDSWGIGKNSTKACAQLGRTSSQLRQREHVLETAVSEYIRAMPFLWIAIDDTPGPASHRGLIERNSIALLSNYQRTPVDSASRDWLGSYCDRPRVRASGLWNSNHVDETYDPHFLEFLESYVDNMTRRGAPR
jgi:hypothetical protein